MSATREGRERRQEKLEYWWHTPKPVRLFSSILILLAFAGTCWGIVTNGGWANAKLLIALAIGGGVVVELGYLAAAGRPVRGQVQWGLSAWPFAAALLVPPLLAGLVAAPIYLCKHYRARKFAAWQWMFSAAVVTVSAWAGGALFLAVVGSALQAEGSATQLGAAAAAMAIYLTMEVILFSTLSHLGVADERLRIGDFYLSELAVLAAGAGVAVVCRYGLEFLILIVFPMVVVLQRAWLYRPYMQSALQDPKTGLFNLQSWRQKATTAAGRELARGRDCAVVFVDLDHFKAVNDDYGHVVGDEVLTSVADALRTGTGTPNLIGRYGGEEFCILLPGAGAQRAIEMAEKLRAEVAALRFSRDDLKITASFGVAILMPHGRPGHGADIDGLVQRADRALYAAKHAGRNCVRLWEDPSN